MLVTTRPSFEFCNDISLTAIDKLRKHMENIYGYDMYDTFNEDAFNYINICLIKYIIEEMKKSIDIDGFAITNTMMNILYDDIFVENLLLSSMQDQDYHIVTYNIFSDLSADNININIELYVNIISNILYNKTMSYNYAGHKYRDIKICKIAISNNTEFKMLMDIFISIYKVSLIYILVGFKNFNNK